MGRAYQAGGENTGKGNRMKVKIELLDWKEILDFAEEIGQTIIIRESNDLPHAKAH
jgi:hypothetical protein